MIPDFAVITLPILGRTYPRLGRIVQEDGLVAETHTTQGWHKVYDLIDTPNLNTPRFDIERSAEDKGILLKNETSFQESKSKILNQGLIFQVIKEVFGEETYPGDGSRCGHSDHQKANY